ncbi:MAG: tandem-95 repeat protein [Magnetococcales bacterium]|nr:tandem-95 repeat protein [Magnetococcales bacterium]
MIALGAFWSTAEAAAPVCTNRILDRTWSGSGNKSFQFQALTFTDPDWDRLTYTASQVDGLDLPSWLTFNASTRTFSGNPPTGTDKLQLKVTANDGHNGTAVCTFSLNLVNANDSPTVANRIPDRTWSGSGSKSYQVYSRAFSDRDGDTLTYTATRSDGSALPSWLRFNRSTRTFSGNPPAGSGSVSVKVRANDGNGSTVSDTFVINYSNANDVPIVANPIADRSWTGSYRIPSTTFSDGDGNTLTYSVKLANGASLPSWLTFNASTRTFSGTAPSSGVSSLNIRVTAKDNKGGSISDTFTLTLPVTNHPPVASTDAVTVTSGQSITDTLNALDGDGDRLSYAIVANPGQGQVTITNAATGAFTYTPNAGATGSDSFTFKANDGQADSNTATVTVTIQRANHAPVATNGTLSVTGSTAATGTLSATDADGDSLTYAIVANGSKGTLTLTNSATGAYRYTPNSGATGTDTFTYKASDGTTDSNTATVTVTIAATTSGGTGEALVIKSGQTTSYATGDDGDLEKGVAWANPRFTDQGDGTVKDNLTALVWMKNANCWNNQTWDNAFTKIEGLNAGTVSCSGYTTGTHTDWRLPNREELSSLIDYGHYNPALPSGHPFSGVQSGNYWSATTHAYNTGFAWLVNLNDGTVYIAYGSVNAGHKTSALYVWPVRGGQ